MKPTVVPGLTLQNPLLIPKREIMRGNKSSAHEIYEEITPRNPQEMDTLCGEENINLTAAANQAGARVTRLGNDQIVVHGQPREVSKAMELLLKPKF